MSSTIRSNNNESSSYVDMDDIIEEQIEKLEHDALLASGKSLADIALYKKQKVFREEVKMYLYFEKTKNAMVTYEEIGMHLASAYENLGRRHLAIESLVRNRMKCPRSPNMILLLAKLYFRDNKKENAEAILLPFINDYKQSLSHTSTIDNHTTNKSDNFDDTDSSNGYSSDEDQSTTYVYNIDDIADAYYILGWIAIHADDHTKAYTIWSEGYEHIPTDTRLHRQHKKVQSWLAIGKDTDKITDNIDALLGECCIFNGGIFNREDDFDAFRVPDNSYEPALGLFDAISQDRKLIFRTRKPILSIEECSNVISIVEAYIKEKGVWGSVRSASLPTTDIAVEDVPILRQWLRCLLANVLQPMLAACYPKLVDGSTLGEFGRRLRVHDAFIVRYDSDKDMSTSLPEHSDTSAISFTVALNSYTNDVNDIIDCSGSGRCMQKYIGGGTWYKTLHTNSSNGVVDCSVGNAVAFAGPLRHGGYPITNGTRYILVLFIYIDKFPYHSYLSNNNCSSTSQTDCSDNRKMHESCMDRDYVVYRETLELMSTLNKNCTLDDNNQ